MNDFKSVEGKVAIITGGASGIGKGIAKVFADNGMKVVIADIQDELGNQFVEEIKSAGGEAIYHHTNVRSEDDIKALMEATVKQYGVLHCMINNAGITQSGHHPTHDFDVEEFDRISEINYRGVFLGTKYAAKTMMDTNAHKCSIINIISTSGLRSSESFSLYDSSKSAVVGYTKSTALDYAKHDITVNGICPGVVETEIYANFSKEDMDYCKALNAIGRMGEVEEIGWSALFLVSDLARFVTGSIITVDGGLYAGDQYPAIQWKTSDPRI